MRVNDMEMLVNVAKSKSITETAREMFISQQGLSRRIQRIETILGVPLFVRCRNGVVVTEAGEKFIVKAKELIAKYDELCKEIEPYRQLSKSPLTGDLIVFSSFHIETVILPKVLKDFKLRHPKVNITTIEKYPTEIAECIQTNSSAIGLVNMPTVHFIQRFADYTNKSSFHRVCDDEFFLCASKSSPPAKNPDTTLKELIKYPVAFYDTKQYAELVALLFEEVGEPIALMKTLSTELYREAISSGLAIGITCNLELSQHASFKESIVTIPTNLTMVYGWMCSADHPMSENALEFIKCYENFFQS